MARLLDATLLLPGVAAPEALRLPHQWSLHEGYGYGCDWLTMGMWWPLHRVERRHLDNALVTGAG